ncbi:MAG: hypothetical protein AB1Z66_11200 [Candidatus Limnocylindrales bacterium]
MSRRAWATILVIVALIIVGSFAFLQTSGSPRPTTYGDIGTELGSGRIERPEPGFAVTTPHGWTAWEPSTDFQDWWGAGTVVHLWLEPAPEADEWWMGTCDIGEDCTLERMVEAGGEAYCWIVDDTELATDEGWSGPAVPASLTATGLAGQPGWTAIDTTLEVLPSGEAGLVRGVDPNGWSQHIWHLSDGGHWFRLLCGVLDGDVEPRSIAESFEFLPVER